MMSLKLSEMAPTDLHFDHAPIVEAIIGIELGLLNDAQMERVRQISTAFHDDYPDTEPLKHFQFGFGVNMAAHAPQPTPPRVAPSFGMKCVSKDKRQLAVLRRNGFSFSRLPPYERWESFRAEAQRLWDFYRACTDDAPILGFGLRYINRLLIPLGEKVENFLTVYPNLPNNPDGSPRVISGSYMRVDSNIDALRGQVILQQATLPTIKEGFATISLDFDLRFMVPEGVGDTYLWEILESARQIKNRLFLESLTPDFLETFR